MDHAESLWGTLPPAWRSTSRLDDPVSGISIFKVPEGYLARGEIAFKDLGIADVELIQNHHRTVCAWPSEHPQTGNTYRWFNRQGELVPEGVVPDVDDHPDLPLAWLEGLANTKANRDREPRSEGKKADENNLPLYDVSAALTEGRPSQKVAARMSLALYAIREGKDRHNSTLEHTMALLRFGSNGEAGVDFAISELNKVFVEVVAPGRDNGEDEADSEFQRMINGAGRLLDEGDEEDEQDRSSKASVATQLVDLALADYTLGTTENHEAFAAKNSCPHIAMMLRSGRTGLRHELARRFFDNTGTAASQQALADALSILEGEAGQQVPQRLGLRVAAHDGSVFIDMGDADAHVIHIGDGDWSIATSAQPVIFRRTQPTLEMPKPVAAVDISKLWKFVPVHKEDRPLILAFLVSSLIQTDVPHPILGLMAEHGSAKTSIVRFLVSLVDPSAVPTRQPPKDMDRWTTAIAASWVVGLDNLSGRMPDWLADAMCRAATGDGDVRRMLYTDNDVTVTAFLRCIVFNGVDLIITRADLIDRLLSVDLPRIKDRRTEADLKKAWANDYPEILGALLTLAAKAHNRLPTITMKDLPRMADFALVLKAVDEILGTNGLQRYRDRSMRDAAETLDDSPFIAELIKQNYTADELSSAEIRKDVTDNCTQAPLPRRWPRGSREVTAELTRNAPAMRMRGWTVDNDNGRNKQNVLRWTITPPLDPEGQKDDQEEKVGKSPSPSSPPSPTGHNSSSEGISGGEGQASQARNTGSPPLDPERQARGTPSSPSSPPSPKTTHVTCEDEEASHASQDSQPSLVLDKRCSKTPFGR